jgi:hypothetical protein
MELNTRVIGKRTSSTEMVWRLGLMELNIKATMYKERNME